MKQTQSEQVTCCESFEVKEYTNSQQEKEREREREAVIKFLTLNSNQIKFQRPNNRCSGEVAKVLI